MSAGTPVLRLTCPEGYELKPDDVRWSETQDWLDEHLKPLLEALPLTHVLSWARLWPQR
jgi:phage FluMu gp28-like protein